MRAAASLLFAFVAVLGGCAPYPYTPYPPRVAPALGEMCDRSAAVRVFYATDRRPTGVSDFDLYYGADRSNEVSYGDADVSIPPLHGRGRIEAGLMGPGDSARHVAMLALSPAIDSAPFLKELDARIRQSKRHEVFVFIHGYNELFSSATRRTAQIAHDVDLDGVAVVYSWPTQGWLASYLVDENNVDWTLPHLVEFLELLANDTEAEHIHIMAHSMGCRLLAKALTDFVRDHDDLAEPPFDQVIFAAADIDVELFDRDYAPHIVRAARRTTVYFSHADWALGMSRLLHRYSRLGEEGPQLETLDEWDTLDAVDATKVDKGVVGHMYFGASPRVLDDVRGIFAGRSPEDRGLISDGRVFRIDPSQSVVETQPASQPN